MSLEHKPTLWSPGQDLRVPLHLVYQPSWSIHNDHQLSRPRWPLMSRQLRPLHPRIQQPQPQQQSSQDMKAMGNFNRDNTLHQGGNRLCITRLLIRTPSPSRWRTS